MYLLLGHRSKLSASNKLLLYEAILKPIWTYGMQLWGTASTSNAEILERLPSKALRMIVDAPWYMPNRLSEGNPKHQQLKKKSRTVPASEHTQMTSWSCQTTCDCEDTCQRSAYPILSVIVIVEISAFKVYILNFPFFCRKIALLIVLGRPLWREDGSVICSAICQWSESRRTHNRTLLSHLRLLGSLSVASYDSRDYGGSILTRLHTGTLRREDGSLICSAICRWSESRRTHNRTLLSRLRLLGSLSVASYDSQGLRWKYSTLSDERTGL
jgi:hypothetical protein